MSLLSSLVVVSRGVVGNLEADFGGGTGEEGGAEGGGVGYDGEC